MEYTHHYQSPLGGITLASNGEALTGLWFDGQKYFGSTLGTEYEEKDLPVFRQTKEWLDLYFDGRKPELTPPVSFRTTPFRKQVWEYLLTIPYGQTVTYGEIAKQIGERTSSKTSARAVGNAVGKNPISIIVPCHRVLGAGGKLTGYAGGTEKKEKLLLLEGVYLPSASCGKV